MTKCVRAGTRNQSQAVFPACHVIISAGIHTKCSVGSIIRCLFKHCLPVYPTRFWMEMFDRLAGALITCTYLPTQVRFVSSVAQPLPVRHNWYCGRVQGTSGNSTHRNFRFLDPFHRTLLTWNHGRLRFVFLWKFSCLKNIKTKLHKSGQPSSHGNGLCCPISVLFFISSLRLKSV